MNTDYTRDRFGIIKDPRTIGVCGKRFEATPMFGIEVELENYKPSGLTDDLSGDFWSIHNDGSLRDGIELVLRHPTSGGDLEQALTEFDKLMNTEVGKKLTVTTRCSTHIHIDMRGRSHKFISMFCFIYCMYEKLIFKSFGENRENNFYCLPYYTNLINLENLSEFIAHDRAGLGGKYSSLNVRPLERYGSIELRIFNAEKTSEGLGVLLDIAHDIYHYVESVEGMAYDEVLTQFSTDAERHLFDKVFTKSHVHFKYDDSDLTESMRTAQRLIVMGDSAKVRNAVMYMEEDSPFCQYIKSKSEGRWKTLARIGKPNPKIQVQRLSQDDAHQNELEFNIQADDFGDVLEALARDPRRLQADIQVNVPVQHPIEAENVPGDQVRRSPFPTTTSLTIRTLRDKRIMAMTYDSMDYTPAPAGAVTDQRYWNGERFRRSFIVTIPRPAADKVTSLRFWDQVQSNLQYYGRDAEVNWLLPYVVNGNVFKAPSELRKVLTAPIIHAGGHIFRLYTLGNRMFYVADISIAARINEED